MQEITSIPVGKLMGVVQSMQKREELVAGVMLTKNHLIKGKGMKSRFLVPVDVMELSFQPWTA